MDPRSILTLAPFRILGVALLVVGVTACAGESTPPKTPKSDTAADDPQDKPTEDIATINAWCNPPAEVLIDGKPAGTSPVNKFKVKPGSHDVTFVDELTGNRTMTVVIEPGDGKVVTSDRPPSATQKQPAKGDKIK